MASNAPPPPIPPIPVNPLDLSIDQAAQMLSAGGGKKITPQQIQADLDAGAPGKLGSGGQIRVNLIHYAAWLLREIQSS